MCRCQDAIEHEPFTALELAELLSGAPTWLHAIFEQALRKKAYAA